MLQETARRIDDSSHFEPPLVVGNREHRFIIAEQLRELKIRPGKIVLEPAGRNTAPAAAVAALMAREARSDGIVFIMPSDHIIHHFEAFFPALNRASEAAREGALVAFGLPPKGPETGYGYIQRGAALTATADAFRVSRYIEKPDKTTAEQLIANGDCYWNSGMFLFMASCYLAELERYSPQVLAAAQTALEESKEDRDFLCLDPEAFANSPSISIDYAVMEKTKNAVVVPSGISWSDVGSWTTLWELGQKDQNQNVLQGDVVSHDLENCYVRAESKMVAAIGLENIIIVETEDAVLITQKEHAQDLKILVDDLKAKERIEVSEHRTVYRPWGSYRTIQSGPRYQVKEIIVQPGAKLSLQMHHHRAEHWVVVHGTAQVVRGDEEMTLKTNESIYIPIGTKHRLENSETTPLILIEVQSGDYLGEDDIVRFDDEYGRAK